MRENKWSMYIDNLQGHPSVCKSNHTIEGIKFITELIPPKKFPRLLDIGAGEGLETKILYDLGYDVLGMIRGEPNLKFARHTYPDIKFIENDMHDLPFPSESFDSVFMNHTFEHSYAPYIFLLELYCILRLNGRMWLAMPDFKEITDPSISDESKIGHHHPNIICSNLLIQFFQTTGFKILNNKNNCYLLEKQLIQTLHSDVQSVIVKRKNIFG